MRELGRGCWRQRLAATQGSAGKGLLEGAKQRLTAMSLHTEVLSLAWG